MMMISEWYHVNQAHKRQNLNQGGLERTVEDTQLTSISNSDSVRPVVRPSVTVSAAATAAVATAAADGCGRGGGDFASDVMDTTGGDLAVAIRGEDQVTSINQQDGEC